MAISLTVVVSNLDKSIDFTEAAPLNIEFIVSTLLVLKVDKLRDFNPLQSSNIEDIFLTDDVDIWDKSTDSNLVQFWNIPAIFSTFSVFNPSKLIEVKLEHPLNKEFKFFNVSNLQLEKSNDIIFSGWYFEKIFSKDFSSSLR